MGFLKRCEQSIIRRWYTTPGYLLLLTPLELLFRWISSRRRHRLSIKAQPFKVPVVVVGNISVGGTGKTPAIIQLAKLLSKQQWRVGVVSRGYGRKSEGLQVSSPESTVEQLGDEAFLIYSVTQCHVAVSRHRNEAVAMLVDEYACDVILADDGLQHYQMHRDLELVLIDGQRLLGNKHLFPVGPLRETPERLLSVDWVLLNTASKEQQGGVGVEAEIETQIESKLAHVEVSAVSLTHIATGEVVGLQKLRETSWVALAGLGNPQKFFRTLTQLNTVFEAVSFPDHHWYSAEELVAMDDKFVIMTEKDAVKCRKFAKEGWYQLDVEMQFPDVWLAQFLSRLDVLMHNKKQNTLP